MRCNSLMARWVLLTDLLEGQVATVFQLPAQPVAPEDYSADQGARFEIHFEKLRNRVDAVAAVPFEASLIATDDRDCIHWSSADLKPPLLMQAAELFSDGMTVREVAAFLRISKSEAGRLRLRALTDGILVPDDGSDTNETGPTIQ
jgi:hypothetical protein